MATFKVIDIISRVESVLQDSGVRWPRVELQSWLNESYLSIVLLRPDANAKYSSEVVVDLSLIDEPMIADPDVNNHDVSKRYTSIIFP